MISQTTEYALRAVVYLAEFPGSPSTIQEIAVAARAPAHYLAKVMQDLVRGRVVISQRGPGGGFVLARTPEQITMYDVVQAVEPISRIWSCPLDRPEHASDLCALHKRLDRAAELVEESFRGATLAEMIETPVFAPPDDQA